MPKCAALKLSIQTVMELKWRNLQVNDNMAPEMVIAVFCFAAREIMKTRLK
jgi:hypothetical protein